MAWRTLLTSYLLWSLIGATSAAYLRNRWVTKIRPIMPVADELADGQQQLSEWQARCGYNPHALVSILPESRAWVDPLGRGVVCYLVKGHTWLAAGDPFAGRLAGD